MTTWWTPEEIAEWGRRFPSSEVYERRQQVILEQGLRCRLHPEVDGDLHMLRVEPLVPGWTALADVAPEFPYHISLFKVWDDFDSEMWSRVVDRFAGREVVLAVASFGSGGTANLHGTTCPVGGDDDVRALHRTGTYWYKDLHISM